MDNKVVRALWLGRDLSLLEVLCIRSFLANDHEFELYVYGEVGRIPEGTRVKDACEVMPESRIFQTQQGFGKGSYATFSNVFRLKLLEELGGWYVDMDVVCLKPFDFTQPNIICSSRRGKTTVPNNNVVRFEPGCEYVRYCREKFEALDPKDSYVGLGPHVFQEAIEKLGVQDYVVEPEVFNPIGWEDVEYYIRPMEPIWHPRRLKRAMQGNPIGRVTGKSYAVHLWSQMWNRNQYDREKAHHPDSVFEGLKRRYLEPKVAVSVAG